MTLAEIKAEARRAAFARRKEAKATADEAAALRHLTTFLAPHAGAALAGYMAIRTEIDPLPVMTSWTGPVGVPVILGPGQPLDFHRWTPHARMIDGPFGARIPEGGEKITPRVLIVPLVAFDRNGGRLGYGGGFYDRTLERLRAADPGTVAVGFAFAAQEAQDLPLESTDQRLDAIVTETGVIALA